MPTQDELKPIRLELAAKILIAMISIDTNFAYKPITASKMAVDMADVFKR